MTADRAVIPHNQGDVTARFVKRNRRQPHYFPVVSGKDSTRGSDLRVTWRSPLETLAMNAEPSTPSVKKLWKKIVPSTVTGVTIIGGLFGIYSFVQNFTPYDLSGEWIITNTIQATDYHLYQGLKLGYAVYLTQRGTDLTGTGEKESENGKDLEPAAHTHIQIAGVIRGRKITATFVEEGSERKSEGKFTWSYQPKTKSLIGKFTSTAADASGSSVAKRVGH